MTDQRRGYLESKVNTASQAELHLMLLEGALRFGRDAEKGLLRADEVAANPPLARTIDILGELIASVRHSDDEVNVKLGKLYEFVLVQVTKAYAQGDHKPMGDALVILEFQRDTWRMAVAKSNAEKAPGAGKGLLGPVVTPHLGIAQAAAGSFALEA
ncbi:MAG: flagellar export chaperone FliS [Lacipirellulaceae bacterium]